MAEQAAQYKCDVCGATFKEADALTKHKVIHESNDTGPNAPLEQGTEKPTQDPSITSPGPTLPH
ncbi:MAG: C2H2-type zinc finger protein [Thaumarchaeota archaeon]|nr:C2H2-type zinc finger protein [Nitrososphaerota archaeon]